MTTTHTRWLAACAAALILGVAGCSGNSASSGPMSAPSAASTKDAAATGEAGSVARQVARTAQMGITVNDPAVAAADLQAAASLLGGYVSSATIITERVDGYYTQPSSVTLSVPAANLDAAMEAAAKVGDVTSRVVKAEDVTGAVVDLDARIKVLGESITRIQDLMGKAGSISDIASIERELTTRQSTLETLLGQQKAMADRVAMAPLTVTLKTTLTKPDSNPFLDGLAAGWQALGAMTKALLTVIGALIPLAVVAAVIVIPIVLWRRKHPRAKPQPPQQPGQQWRPNMPPPNPNQQPPGPAPQPPPAQTPPPPKPPTTPPQPPSDQPPAKPQDPEKPTS